MSATNSKNKTLIMLESIREKLFSLQPEPSTSIVEGSNDVNRNAGASLLQKYQNDWKALHRLQEENAKLAQDVDKTVDNILRSCTKQEKIVSDLLTELNMLPSISKDLKTAIKNIGSLHDSFRDVEVALYSLENIVEMQELKDKQLNEKFNLQLYKDKKTAELEVFKSQLAKKHDAKIHEIESEQQFVLKERQKAFAEAFEADMQHYKTHGQIERVTSVRCNNGDIKLEDIELEQDDALDTFLAVEATEETVMTS